MHATGLVSHERYFWHDPGSGPGDYLLPIRPRLARIEELSTFHTQGYIERVRAISQAGGERSGTARR